MNASRRSFFFCLPGVLLTLPAAVMASGKYKGRGPTPPGRLEAEKYNLGKKIFTGKAELDAAASADVDEQARALSELRRALPASADRRSDLPALAGKLSPDQFAALEYYLIVRYDLGGES